MLPIIGLEERKAIKKGHIGQYICVKFYWIFKATKMMKSWRNYNISMSSPIPTKKMLTDI